MAGSSSLTPEEISKLAAPLLFGPLFNWALYGVLCVQTYVYSYNFPNDRLLIKILVYFVFALETTQTALTGADIYYWFIAGFGNSERLLSSHFLPIDVPIMNAVIAPLIQMYFCSRIWTLTKNVWLCAAIAVMSMASATGSAWGGFVSILVGKYAVSKVALYLWLVPSALVDITIATAMCLLLRKIRASEGFSFSRFVLVRVVRLTIETNALTASIAILSFVLYAAFPNEIYCVFTNAFLGKLYSNTLLVSLNNRIYFRDHSGSSGDGDTHFTVASRVRTTRRESIHFTTVETQLRSPVQVLKLETSPYKRDVESGNVDSASINFDPSHALGDVVHIKTDPSIEQSSRSTVRDV